MSAAPLPRHLAPIVADVARRAQERRRRQPLARLERLVRQDLYRRERVLNAFARPGFALIAECKRRSPEAGELGPTRVGDHGADGDAGVARVALARAERHDWFERAALYAEGGATALSIVTEEDHFGGALSDLRTVEHVGLPRLRKDFVLDEGMVLETMVYGADMILFLPSVLEDDALRRLDALAKELGLARLIAVHDERGLALAAELEPEFLGVDARDPATAVVDLATVERLVPAIPPGPIRVAEGGLGGPADLVRARDAGAQAALVGTALMRAADPAATLRAWTQALAAAR
jgi:indole-3-glycerol phosphate synthase